MAEDRGKKIHASDETPDEEVEAHVKKGGRDRLDEPDTDKNDDSDDVQAHVRSHRT
jgi:hypothetical protein